MKIAVNAIKQEIEVRKSSIAEAKKSIENLKRSAATIEMKMIADADEVRALMADLRLLTEETNAEENRN